MSAGARMRIVKDATVIPMHGERVLPHHDVLIDGETIADVVPSGGALPEDAVAIDARGRFAMPGIVDAHVHFVRGDAAANAALRELFLVNGSTTALCLDGFGDVLELARGTATGELFGPSIVSSGPIHDEPGLSYEDGRAAVLREADAGFRFVKVYNELPVEGYRGLVDGAREAGIRVLGHVTRAPGIDGVFAARQDSIVHAEEFLYTYFGYSVGGDPDWRRGGPLDVSRLPALAERVAELGMIVGPTLHCFHTIWQQAEDLRPLLRADQLDCLPASLVEGWLPPRNRYVREFATARHRRNLLEGFWFQVRLVEELHAAGVPLTAGTDAAVPHLTPASIHAEIAHLAACGLGNYEALRCATVEGAQLLEPGTKAGTLQRGAPADLLLLASDPLADVRATADIAGVMARGAWHDRAALDARLAALRAMHGPATAALLAAHDGGGAPVLA